MSEAGRSVTPITNRPRVNTGPATRPFTDDAVASEFCCALPHRGEPDPAGPASVEADPAGPASVEADTVVLDHQREPVGGGEGDPC